MDLKSISRRIAALTERAPRPRLHPGRVVIFRASDGDGHPLPLPADVPHRQPEARDPRAGLDVVWLDECGGEITRCA
jgi:hypothetical protein